MEEPVEKPEGSAEPANQEGGASAGRATDVTRAQEIFRLQLAADIGEAQMAEDDALMLEEGDGFDVADL